MDLNQKSIIVTGASSGIGLDLVKELLLHNCNIIAVARSIEKIDFHHDRVTKYPCDISKLDNIDALFKFALEKWNTIDLFVCNAGFAYYGEIAGPNWKEIEKIYQTNVFSAIYVAEKMKALHGKKPFQVAITASAMSFLSYPGYTLYASTKAALHGFATGYRCELSRGQKIQMIYPIATRTKFFEQAGEKTPIPWPSQTPDKVAGTIVKGLIKGKNSIFPSKLFQSLNIINGYLPFLFKVIIVFETFKFKQWLKKK
ncbi:MAG: SDR family NAD(P)-dependent oxidoreductase [Pseudomonadota bacterium]